MKKILMAGAFVLLFHFVNAQERHGNDPTYSVNNYKHFNKAQYARLNNLDKLSFLETSVVRVNENYKQPHNNVQAEKAVITSRKMDKSTKSYKHPNGL